ncbi:MAG: acetyl-CoA carboxylase biotin carboxyl carrier protein [Kordiimonadaceae bacterium]|nr:acetyl-CoA carboxylase biotin carboxyl carrier protein [Kordiimonadaceae bacterium]
MSKLTEYKDLIHELAELLDKSTLSEIEVEEDSFRIRVARELTSGAGIAVQAAPVAVAAAPAPAIAVAATPEPASTANPADHPGAIPSPMVGTVFLAPSPDAEPFIKVGDTVKEGDTLLIIEAMKVMNQIASKKSGVVKEILFSDAQPVEFGEVLCIIE